MTVPLLELDGVKAGYGDINVLHSISMRIYAEGTVCLIGSNGAGKSTLLNTISGILKTTSGTILIDGQDVTNSSCRRRVEGGVIQIPEGRRLFAGMSVRQNLLMGAFLRRDTRATIRRDLDFVFETFPRLAEKSRQDASTMSGGEQQMCAIGRGIMAKPRLLMIDELSLGLAPKVVEEITSALRIIASAGVSLLVVEQDVFTALEMTRHGYVLDEGRITIDGPSDELLENPMIRHAYLGVEVHAH
jgi:branched-chain amino acid transport system ATP-binding protein